MSNPIGNLANSAVNNQQAVNRGQFNAATNQPVSQQSFNFTGMGNGLNLQLLVFILQVVQLLLQALVGQDEKEYRSADGSGNNRNNPDWGASGQPVNKLLTPDTTREPGGTTEANLPSARAVSNAVSDQSGSTENYKGLSDLFWVWGQFLDHDITLIEGHGANGTADIAVPKGDPFFDPAGTIGFTRSDTVTNALGQKTQVNDITAYIDGSNVYGSDEETASALRSYEGGRLKLDENNLLPKGEDGHYQAGDIRANENIALTSMHTLWVREHNRIADELSAQNPDWGDEKIYQEAREQVVAQLQAITYNEFLPNLLGENALGRYEGYDPTQNAQMNSEFSTAAFRFGHTMLSPTLLRLDANGNEVAEGNLALRDAFFQPNQVEQTGIDAILRGAASQTAQAVDTQVVDDVRNFLFGPPGAGGFDLVSLNIQRGRDHALPGYNDAREQLGLGRIESFNDPIWADGVGEKLAQIYDHPDDVDLWVAGLAEQHVNDSLLGETATRVLTLQFEALRDGDRFWYENRYSGEQLSQLNDLSLADIIRRNTGATEIQDNAMVASNIHQGGATNQTTRIVSPMIQGDFQLQGQGAGSGAGSSIDPDAARRLQQAFQQGTLG